MWIKRSWNRFPVLQVAEEGAHCVNHSNLAARAHPVPTCDQQDSNERAP